SLPWEAATTLPPSPTPFTLDAKLFSALEGVVDKQGLQGRVRSASLAFLYLYMTMCSDIRPTCNITTRSALPIGAGLVLHGNPSGVDNTVAVFGGGLGFTRDGFGERKGVEVIPAFKSIRFLLTDSKVPRDTKKLVAGVGQMKADRPALVAEILDRIQSISDEAKRALGDPELKRGRMLAGLEALMDENHGHLVTLGVSHPTLEQIKDITAKSDYGLHTKLTGAGGGGCAVTIIPDDFSESKMTSLLSDLRAAGFVPYNTAVGGSGLGVFHPHSGEGRPSTTEQTAEAGEAFKKIENGDLGAWADGVGRWFFNSFAPPTNQALASARQIVPHILPTGSLEDPFNWSQLPPDEEGAELSKEARVWKVYVGEADKWDAEKADGWNKSLDVLLVFLRFTSTSQHTHRFRGFRFLIESSGMLKQDPNDVTAAALVSITQLLTAIATNSSTNPKLATPDQGNTVDGGFVPSPVAIVVNTLWFLSLALSISASFLAMLAKDWCHSFTAHRTGHHRDQAHRRQRKWTMIEQWKMEELILMLPSLIHLSLALFATGLCIYLWDLNSMVAVPVICVCGTAFAFYALSSITAAFIDHFPYTTMVTWVLRSAFVHNCYSAVTPVARHIFYYLSPLIIAIPLRLTTTLLIALAELVLFPAVVIDLISTRYIFYKLGDIYAVPIFIGRLPAERLFEMTGPILSRSWSRVCLGIKHTIGLKRLELSQNHVTSLSLSWLLEYCETPKSVALTLQAIAGATKSIPNEPLIKHGARWQILQQLVSNNPDNYISLYSRALNFLQKQPAASPNGQLKADLGSSDIRTRIWDFQEHQDR
ncbi:unnamed protein product, partial [Rhizoctonia solani]